MRGGVEGRTTEANKSRLQVVYAARVYPFSKDMYNSKLIRKSIADTRYRPCNGNPILSPAFLSELIIRETTRLRKLTS